MLVGLAALAAVGVVVRRRLLARAGGTFELSVRLRMRRPGRGWVLGIGRYREGHLEFFRIFSLSPRPRRSWGRASLQVDGTREPVGAETYTLFNDHVVVRCTSLGPQRAESDEELAMSSASLLGLQSWLESAPPTGAPREG